MSVLPRCWISFDVTTCTGLVLVRLGAAMREPVTTISSTSSTCAFAATGAMNVSVKIQNTRSPKAANCLIFMTGSPLREVECARRRSRVRHVSDLALLEKYSGDSNVEGATVAQVGVRALSQRTAPFSCRINRGSLPLQHVLCGSLLRDVARMRCTTQCMRTHRFSSVFLFWMVGALRQGRAVWRGCRATELETEAFASSGATLMPPQAI